MLLWSLWFLCVVFYSTKSTENQWDMYLTFFKTSGYRQLHQRYLSFDRIHSSSVSLLAYFLFWGSSHCWSSCIPLLFKLGCRNGDICAVDTKSWKSHPRHLKCPQLLLPCLPSVFEFREGLFPKHSMDFSVLGKAVSPVKKYEVFLLLPFIS